ncbi:MAG TPA: hypothetical protein VGM23_11255, partial [Armatimonadota bacterium]
MPMIYRTALWVLISILCLWTLPVRAGSRIVFISGGQLYSMAPDGSQLTKLTTTGADVPVASRDGTLVAFKDNNGFSLLDVVSMTIKRLPVRGPLGAFL